MASGYSSGYAADSEREGPKDFLAEVHARIQAGNRRTANRPTPSLVHETPGGKNNQEKLQECVEAKVPNAIDDKDDKARRAAMQWRAFNSDFSTYIARPSHPYLSPPNQGSIGLRVNTKTAITISTHSPDDSDSYKESNFALPTPESLCSNPFEQEESVAAPSLTEPSLGESAETIKASMITSAHVSSDGDDEEDEVLLGRANQTRGSNGRFPPMSMAPYPVQDPSYDRHRHARGRTPNENSPSNNRQAEKGNKENVKPEDTTKTGSPASKSKNSPVAMKKDSTPNENSPSSNCQAEKGNKENIKPEDTANSGSPAPKPKKTPVAMKKDPYAGPPPEALAELKRLQEPILKNAQANRFQEEDHFMASPKTLAEARDGPGTDPTSEVFDAIQRTRNSPARIAGLSSSSAAAAGLDLLYGPERHEAQWTAYKASPRAYSAVEKGKVVLCSEPLCPEQEYVDLPEASRLGLNQEQCIEPEEFDEAAENKWSADFSADWEYQPRLCSNYEAFRDWFRTWLETTIRNSCLVDIYHESFFDGTAHADGAGSLFIGNFEHEAADLDLQDEATRLHHHESAAGYIQNYTAQLRKKENEEAARKQRARAAYIEGLKAAPKPNPNVPKANIYLRPAEFADCPELATLMNWYMEHSPISTDDIMVRADDVRRRIEDCRHQFLPFIVAVERRATHAYHDVSRPEKILGFALANDFIGKETTARHTVTLQLFVRHDSKRKGIGRCLMDKLLEVCDPTFKSKQGYWFENGTEDHMGYYPGGGRKLSRLIFKVIYPDNRRANFDNIIEWLKKFDFEEQGVLKGAAVKFDRYLDVCYLVRNVAFSEGGVFQQTH